MEMVSRRAWAFPRNAWSASATPPTRSCGEADAYGADLVAVTTAGKSGLERLVMGSVADQVFRRARLPVLL